MGGVGEGVGACMCVRGGQGVRGVHVVGGGVGGCGCVGGGEGAAGVWGGWGWGERCGWVCMGARGAWKGEHVCSVCRTCIFALPNTACSQLRGACTPSGSAFPHFMSTDAVPAAGCCCCPRPQEEGISQGVIDQLTAKGHTCSLCRSYARSVFGKGTIITRDQGSGVLAGGCDPRGDGCVLAW